MSVIVPLEGKFLTLTVYGKNELGKRLPIPVDATCSWSIDNPVIANISEITPGDGSTRKVAPNASGERGVVNVTCIVSFIDIFNDDTPVVLTKVFNVLIGDELPTEIDFDSEVTDEP